MSLAPDNAARFTAKNLWVAVVFLALVMGSYTNSKAADSVKPNGVLPSSAAGAEPSKSSANNEGELSLPQKAVEIGRVFGFPITNSMLVSWIAALGLIMFAQLATRKMQQVPSGAQNFLELLVESLYSFLEGIIGPHLVKRTFWFFATVFI